MRDFILTAIYNHSNAKKPAQVKYGLAMGCPVFCTQQTRTRTRTHRTEPIRTPPAQARSGPDLARIIRSGSTRASRSPRAQDRNDALPAGKVPFCALSAFKTVLSALFCFCGPSAPFCVRFFRVPYQIALDPQKAPFCALSAGPRQIVTGLLAAPCTDLGGCCYQSVAVTSPLPFCDVAKPSGKSELLRNRIAHSDGKMIHSANFQTRKSVERHNIIMYILDIY